MARPAAPARPCARPGAAQRPPRSPRAPPRPLPSARSTTLHARRLLGQLHHAVRTRSSPRAAAPPWQSGMRSPRRSIPPPPAPERPTKSPGFHQPEHRHRLRRDRSPCPSTGSAPWHVGEPQEIHPHRIAAGVAPPVRIQAPRLPRVLSSGSDRATPYRPGASPRSDSPFSVSNPPPRAASTRSSAPNAGSLVASVQPACAG